MTKVDIVTLLYEKVGLPKREAQDIVDAFFDTIKDTLIAGEQIKLSGFGVLNVRKKGARIGRNPKTKQDVEIKPRKVVTFRTSEMLKKSLNKI